MAAANLDASIDSDVLELAQSLMQKKRAAQAMKKEFTQISPDVLSRHSNPNNQSLYVTACGSCKSLNIQVAGLLFWGIGINILFFMLYKVSVGATREDFLKKMEQDELIAAFSFIVILNFLFYILLYVSYKVVEDKIGQAKYFLLYGWVGGLRHRCTSWMSAIPSFIGGVALAFSGLWFYLISVAY